MFGLNNYGMVPSFGLNHYGSYIPSFAGSIGSQMPVAQFPFYNGLNSNYGWNNSIAPINRAPWTVDANYTPVNSAAFGRVMPTNNSGTGASYGYTSPIHSNWLGSTLPFAGHHSDVLGGQFPTNLPMNNLWHGSIPAASQQNEIAGSQPFGSSIPNSPIAPAADHGFAPTAVAPAPAISNSPINAPARTPLINLWEGDASLFIDVEIPGVNLDDVDLEVAGHTLIIRTARGVEQDIENRRPVLCERALVGYTRAIQLPVEVDCENVDAKLVNGILRLVLPKVAVQQRRTIRVSHLATA